MFARTAISLILLLATALTQGCDQIGPGNVAKSPTGTANLAIAKAHITRHPDVYEAMGTVRAQTSSVIASKMMGTVSRILVEEGQHVGAGELLVMLDSRQVSAQQRQAEAVLAGARKAEDAALSALESARAGAELARTNYSRYVAMLAEEAVTQQEVDAVIAGHRQAQAALSQAEAMAAAARSRVEQARASVTGAKISSGDASVAAPYAGIVTAKLVDVGDLASPGTPLLKVEQVDGYRVDLELPENHNQSIRIGETVSVRVPAANGSMLDGKVETIVPTADTQSRSFLVKVRLPDAPHIKSGMFARVSIPIGEKNIMLVPLTAIVHEGQLTGIFTLDSDQTARFRLLRTGRTMGTTVEILSGLMEGARYVVAPPPGFMDGTKVEGAS